jgi:hypothetical protein
VSEDENDDDDTKSEAASETSHSNGHDATAQELDIARRTSSLNTSPEKPDLNTVAADYVNGHEAKETSDEDGEDSDNNSEEDDDEPVLKYELLRDDAQALLEKDNASALAVSLRLMVSCSQPLKIPLS